MGNKFAVWLVGVVLLLGTLAGCEEVGHYSTSSNLRLGFSADTLSFDTVFTAVGSATGQFMVYNPNSENMRIESVSLANADRSGFRINVDGRKGESFQNIDIWKKDSLYILVEVTVNPTDAEQPMVIEDSVIFYTNGVRQCVLLQAYGQNVHLIKGGVTYSENTTLKADLPYLIYDSLVIGAGATATVEPGATFYFHKGANLIIQGTISAKGTQDDPIIFRGDRMDYINASVLLPYDRTPGQWGGIRFGASSFNNEFEQVIVRNTTTGIVFEESTPDQPKIRISNSQITNSKGSLLTAVNCRIESSNSEFSNAADYTVMLVGGTYQFTHCTLANYITLETRHSTPVLVLSDTAQIGNKSVYYPLQQAYFDNCIIDGSLNDTTHVYKGEIMFSTRDNQPAGSDAFNYRFHSCFIKTQRVTENSRFSDNLYAKSPTYILKGGEDNEYAFDYRLANESVGISGADRTISAQYPVDRYGVNRLDNETGPSIGAYEYVYQEEEKK